MSDEAQTNLALVTRFYNQVFNDHQVDEGAAVVADDYIQHNPYVPDGKAPFTGYFSQFFIDNPDAKCRIVRAAAADDLVWLHVHFTQNAEDPGRAIVDIFRVENGKIVEHWDVQQDIPANPANENTMF